MGAELVIANLLRIAREDLEGAKVLAAHKNRNATYLLEQAAEKIIKAVLTSEGTPAGIRHQLDDLVRLVPDANPLKPLLKATEELAAYATTFRYAKPSGRIPVGPTAGEFQTLLTSVEVALAEAVGRFGVDLGDPTKPAGRPGPVR